MLKNSMAVALLVGLPLIAAKYYSISCLPIEQSSRTRYGTDNLSLTDENDIRSEKQAKGTSAILR